MPNLLQSTCQTAEVNCTPLSVVMTAGTPNLEIQPATRASAQAVAVVEDRGITSIHLVVLLTIVSTCETFSTGRQRAHQVHVYMCEAPAWDWYWLHWS